MTKNDSISVILSTVPDRKTGEKIATTLVEGRFAACVNILPNITSIYRWKDKIEHEEELLLIIKSADERIPALIEKIQEIHPYEVPEIIEIEVKRGGNSYLNWVVENSTPDA
ncbi:MAG: divalent-cation tolerance protein CutA [Candidatus Lindowbacteria bacterium]|nr:divalent-cation tolerance protein CutA [Candidatus Lindowbacteria bacterium]